MPVTILGNTKTARTLGTFPTDIKKYKYPFKKDLRPDKEASVKIVSEIIDMAQASVNQRQGHLSHWRELDRLMNVFVPSDFKGNNSKNTDMRVVIPTLYATRETLLTYMASAFFQDPMFKFQPTGPEDIVGASVLELVVNFQAKKQSFALNKMIQWKDAFTYGYGIDLVRWKEEWGYKREAVKKGNFDAILDRVFRLTTASVRRKRYRKYEGNELINVSPYSSFPDPNQPIHDPKSWQYFGFISSVSIMDLIEMENDFDGDVFNVEYVKHIDNPISRFMDDSINDYNSSANYKRNTENTASTRVDILWMYANIIPKDWGLGNKNSPEKWLIGVVADSVIIYASPLDLDHDEFPITVCAPDFDGYHGVPISRMGIVKDLQNTIDFMYNSHILNIRKALNDMLIIDPSMININDLSNPEPGKLIRLRRAAWGGNKLDQAVKQLTVQDITASNMNSASILEGFMKSSIGASDMLQGSLPDRTSRISANEISGARQASLSKLQKVASIISMQSMVPTAYFLASHTQQFMDDDLRVRMTGEHKERLKETFGVDMDYATVSPLDIIADYDIIPSDGTIPGNQDSQTWIQLYQTIAQNESLSSQTDMLRLLKYIARTMGVNNVDEFIKKAPTSMRSQVMPEDQLTREVDKGNLVAV